jgi:hypothetical protein
VRPSLRRGDGARPAAQRTSHADGAAVVPGDGAGGTGVGER